MNVVSGASVVIGAWWFLWLEPGNGDRGMLLAFSGGVYVYVAATECAATLVHKNPTWRLKLLNVVLFIIAPSRSASCPAPLCTAPGTRTSSRTAASHACSRCLTTTLAPPCSAIRHLFCERQHVGVPPWQYIRRPFLCVDRLVSYKAVSAACLSNFAQLRGRCVDRPPEKPMRKRESGELEVSARWLSLSASQKLATHRRLCLRPHRCITTCCGRCFSSRNCCCRQSSPSGSWF